MTGALKKLLYVILGIAAFLALVTIAISLLIDPNNYRDDIAEAAKRQTGRDLVIEGDLDLSIFPWFALTAGRTTLANAPGFGDEPFLSFEEARLSIEVMPLIRGEGLKIGAVVLDSFQLNLAVAEDGRNNWQDIPEHVEAAPEADESELPPEVETDIDDAVAEAEGVDITLSIASIDISNAAVSYRDAQTGANYSLTNFNLSTGRVSGSEPIDIRSSFDFEAQPANLAGDFRIETAIIPDKGGITLGDADISTVGIDASVSLLEESEGFHVEVDAFSLKSLMNRLNIEPPVTADPDALGKVIFAADLRINDDAIALSGVELVVDDTTFKGGMSVATDGQGAISVDLAADAIDLGRYMAPAPEASAAAGDTVPVEIPVELIRALNVRGNLTVEAATLSGMVFENAKLGLRAADGDLRMHPIAADLFGGKYEGDVRINASGNVPALSVNENIRGVSLGSLASAMFDRKDITGTINGAFKLGGSGADFAAIQRGLDGSISMELIDGAWEGTDIWHELRRARAMLRQETPPEPTLPARTQFSNVRIAGPVTDGVFRNDDLFAELPFMQLSGRGTVNIPAAELDYRMTARILDKPELASKATPEELEDFTEAKIPIRITGPLADPTIAPDIETLLRQEVEKKVEEELKDRLLDKLLRDND